MKFQPIIQPKVKIGPADDHYEQEADRMADQVLQMPQSPSSIQRKTEEEELQMKPLGEQITPIIQKKSEEEEELQMKGFGDGIVQRKEGEASPKISNQLSQSKGSGTKLSKGTNDFMSNAFGTDFSQVNIHTGADAIQMNRSLGAKAFTHGNDVFFNQGEYDPSSKEGKHLLAHELTHVVQQTGGLENRIMKQDSEEQSVGAVLNDGAVSDHSFISANSPVFIDNAFQTIRWNLIDNYYELYNTTDFASSTPIRLLKSEPHVETDPLAAFSGPINNVYKDKQSAETAIAQFGVEGAYTFYYRDGYIFPTTISETTCPILIHNLKRVYERIRTNAKAGEDLSWDLLFWYIGARMIKPSTPKPTTPTRTAPPTQAGAAPAAGASTVFNAASVSDELYQATTSIVSPGRRMLEVAKQLSSMPGLTAQQKSEVMLAFFNRIGFAIGRAGVVDDGASLIMHSEDGLYAFKFVKDTGKILYARFDMEKMKYVFEAIK